MYVCMYVCMYIYIFVYTHTERRELPTVDSGLRRGCSLWLDYKQAPLSRRANTHIWLNQANPIIKRQLPASQSQHQWHEAVRANTITMKPTFWNIWLWLVARAKLQVWQHMSECLHILMHVLWQQRSSEGPTLFKMQAWGSRYVKRLLA